ncbi:MAG: hypothetical protein OEY38_22790 [Gammaproteobacteria bacterium]|nr:hypothetical protein [Gammaproteobacteria bacterium]
MIYNFLIAFLCISLVHCTNRFYGDDKTTWDAISPAQQEKIKAQTLELKKSMDSFNKELDHRESVDELRDWTGDKSRI